MNPQTVDNFYGIYIDSNLGNINSSNKWGFYNDLGFPSYFKGYVGIGTANPQSKLHVVKAASDITPAIIEGCPVFTDNIQAAALPIGGLYRTPTGILMVKY